ncbi:MAG: D-alanyl-D-alanine carboxypeptidase [bacterium]|nr:D-alanyl-D-alanine carboxypeptidase [bacterium]
MRLLQNALTGLLSLLLVMPLVPSSLDAAPSKQRLADQSKTKAGVAAPVARKAQPAAKKNTKATAKNVRTAKPVVKAQAKVAAGSARKAGPVTKAKTAKKQQAVAAAKKNARAGQTARTRVQQPSSQKQRQALAARSNTPRNQAATNARIRTHSLQSVPSLAALSASALPGPTDNIFNPIEAPLKLTSRSYMVMDAVSGGTITAKNPDTPRQPASTIKILTGLIALKSLGNNDAVPVSRYAAGMPSSKVHLQTQKTYRACDMINSVLLASANDASVALAERIAGSESRFAQLMTYSAQRWGAKNTVCRTASGLTAEGQQSTARDLAQLFRVAMQDKEFAKRMRERSATTSFGKTLRNHNKALWQLDGAMAGKTGYTNAARQTYVGQFSRDGHTIVVAIMGSETMWADLQKLVDYGFKRKTQEMARLRSQNRM